MNFNYENTQKSSRNQKEMIFFLEKCPCQPLDISKYHLFKEKCTISPKKNSSGQKSGGLFKQI